MGSNRRFAFCLMSGLAVLSAGISPIHAQFTQSNGAQSADETYDQPVSDEQHLQHAQAAYLSEGSPQTGYQTHGAPISIRERAATLLQSQRGRSLGYNRLPKDNPLSPHRTNNLFGKPQVSVLSVNTELNRSNSAQQESGIQPFAEPPIDNIPKKVLPPSNPLGGGQNQPGKVTPTTVKPIEGVEGSEPGNIPFPSESTKQESPVPDPGSGTNVPKSNLDSQPPVPEPVADNQPDPTKLTGEVPLTETDPSVQVDPLAPTAQPQPAVPYPVPQQMISPEMAPPEMISQPYCQPYCQPNCQPAYRPMQGVPAPPGYEQSLAPTLAGPTFAESPPNFSEGVVSPECNVYSDVVSDCSTCQTNCRSSCRSGCQSCSSRCRNRYFNGFVGYTGLSDLEGRSNGGRLMAKSGAGMGIALGRRHGCNLRSELEFAYRENDIRGIEFRGNQTALDGELESYSGMVNAYWDFVNVRTCHFKPYVGGGIGFTTIESTIRDLSGNNLVDPGTDDSSFAYQLIAGVNCETSRNMILFVEYRFFDATDFDIESNVPDTSDRYSFDTNNVFVGFRCKF